MKITIKSSGNNKKKVSDTIKKVLMKIEKSDNLH